MMSKRFFRLRIMMNYGICLSVLASLLFSASPAAAQANCQDAPVVGDWIIDSDCVMQENQAAPEDVIITGGAELTVPAGVTLGVGFDSYHLQVQNGSRVRVQNGGRIATYRCPAVEPELLNAPFRFRYGLTATDLMNDFYSNSGLAGQGYRPHRLTGYRLGNSTRFATNWLQIGGPVRPSDFNMTALGFDARRQTLAAQGFRPIDVSAYNPSPGVARFADIWVLNSDGLDWQIFPDDTLAELEQRSPQGLVPVRVEAYQVSTETRYISLWVESACKWNMELRMTRQQYQDLFDQYSQNGPYRLVHLDQYTEGGDVYYAAIWWQRPSGDPGQQVRSDRDWYLFQSFLNNNWCNGFALTNFYAAEHPDGVDGVHFGGIWTYDEPLNVTQTSPLSLKVQQEINCTDGNADGVLDGRGGVSIVRINADTGAIEDEIHFHADQIYGASSTIKIAIAFTVLRLIDQDPNITLYTPQINVGNAYGANQGSRLTAFQIYPISYLLQAMIADSNNWATNRLIDCISSSFIFVPLPPPLQGQACMVVANSVATANQAMQQDLAPLGLTNTQLQRYMTGGPNVGTDYQNGLDVTTTPREMTTLLRFLHDGVGPNGNLLLSVTSYNFLWNTLQLDPDDFPGSTGGDGVNTKGNIEDLFTTGISNTWTTMITIFNKIGNNCWGYGQDMIGNNCQILTATVGTYTHKPQISGHHQQSEAGRLNLDVDSDGNPDSFIFYGIYVDEADGPRPLGGATLPRTFSCIGAQVMREYSGRTNGNLLTITPPCRSP